MSSERDQNRVLREREKKSPWVGAHLNANIRPIHHFNVLIAQSVTSKWIFQQISMGKKAIFSTYHSFSLITRRFHGDPPEDIHGVPRHPCYHRGFHRDPLRIYGGNQDTPVITEGSIGTNSGYPERPKTPPVITKGSIGPP